MCACTISRLRCTLKGETYMQMNSFFLDPIAPLFGKFLSHLRLLINADFFFRVYGGS